MITKWLKKQMKKNDMLKFSFQLKIVVLLLCAVFYGVIHYTFSDFTDNCDTALIDASLIKVVDGDTLLCSVDGNEIKVRLIGVDTPESVNPDADKNTDAGVFVSNWLKDYLVDTKIIQLEYDIKHQDNYGRELCYVYVDGVMLQKILLEQGYAKTMTVEPNTKMAEEFYKIEQNAKNNNVGLWKGN